MSTMQYPEIAFYPDSHKVGVIAPSGGVPGGTFRQLHRIGESLSYYDGEDG